MVLIYIINYSLLLPYMGNVSSLMFNIDFINIFTKPYLPCSMAFLSVWMAKNLGYSLPKIIMYYTGGFVAAGMLLGGYGIIESKTSKKPQDPETISIIVIASMGISVIHLAIYYAGIFLLKAFVIPIIMNLAK